MSSAPETRLKAKDSVAVAVELYARSMAADGYGKFSIRKAGDEVLAGLGPVEVRGENSDVALLRLANALLDHAALSAPFLERLRNPTKNPPAVRLCDKQFTVRTTAGRQ